jgi:C1A family cysteine protease
MQNFLYSNSPLSVCVDAEIWQYYTGGVITTSSGCGRSIDHCVQVTGWQQMQGMTVWNVRNSWGTSWGDNGYIYVQKGSDVCAIAEVVTVPCVQNKSNGQSVC